MSISPSRVAAFDILNRIERDHAYSSSLLPQTANNLSPADRGLCYELTLGVLRQQLFLDRLIHTLSGGRRLDREVAIALRLGVYQMRFLERVPAYSAVSESVELVQRARKSSAKGFVNALLRKYQKQEPELQFADELDRVSVTTSHPRWLIEKWAEDMGMETAAELAEANNRLPETAFRVLIGNSDVDKLLERSRPSEYVEGCFLTNGSITDVHPLAAGGLIYIQGEASQLTSMTVDVDPGESFLDVCAAPGGKTGHIARRSRESCLIVAGDLHRQRVEHLKMNCEMQGAGEVCIVQYDAVNGLPFANNSFDSILVDAPCSGTGTIRSNPELRYFLEPQDLQDLATKQLAILLNASKLLKRDGTLVYSTCSLEPEENEWVCASFVEKAGDIVQEQPRVGPKFLTPNGYARTWPHRDNMDGFFIAAFRRE